MTPHQLQEVHYILGSGASNRYAFKWYSLRGPDLTDDMYVLDTCVVVLTLFRSWQLRSVRKLWQSQLMQVLMKDGTLSLCLVCVK